MARIHLIVGPVGAGKSTFALQLAAQHDAVRFNLDEWMPRLFSPDRPATGVIEWYVERAARCVDQIWSVTQQLLGLGIDVVLEIGLIRRHEREALYARVDAEAFDLTIYVLDAPRELRRERVAHRNIARGATFAMEVPPHIFELASNLWEPPTDVECDGREVRFLTT
ncbi:MAG TPA: AAA family ATPase [Thermoanaerobaculia bacterium]